LVLTLSSGVFIGGYNGDYSGNENNYRQTGESTNSPHVLYLNIGDPNSGKTRIYGTPKSWDEEDATYEKNGLPDPLSNIVSNAQ